MSVHFGLTPLAACPCDLVLFGGGHSHVTGAPPHGDCLSGGVSNETDGMPGGPRKSQPCPLAAAARKRASTHGAQTSWLWPAGVQQGLKSCLCPQGLERGGREGPVATRTLYLGNSGSVKVTSPLPFLRQPKCAKAGQAASEDSAQREAAEPILGVPSCRGHPGGGASSLPPRIHPFRRGDRYRVQSQGD